MTAIKPTFLLCLVASLTALAATEEKLSKRFPVEPGGTLVVDVDLGSVAVSTNAVNEVTVDVWRKVSGKSKADEEAFLGDRPVTFTQDGNTVAIRSRAKTEISWPWSGWRRTEGKYTITVPARFQAQLKTSGGGIEVNDVSGDVKAHTSGGGIDVAGGAGSLDSDTSGGSVKVKEFRGLARVHTSGGGITVENVTGKVDGSTSGGSVSAVLPAPLLEDVRLSTSGGGVTVRVPENAAFNLDAETSGGHVSSELPVTVMGKQERARLKGAVNGGGKTVVLRSSGGSIRVRKL